MFIIDSFVVVVGPVDMWRKADVGEPRPNGWGHGAGLRIDTGGNVLGFVHGLGGDGFEEKCEFFPSHRPC
jgi:hypothetical protein